MSSKISLTVIDGPEQAVDEEEWDHYAYKVRLRYQGRTMTSPWKQGTALTQDPTARDVLESLLLDAAGFDNAQDFYDWCAEYGYDTDSRKAEAIYRAVEAQTNKLRRLLDDDYEQAVFPTARDDHDSERVARRLAEEPA